MSSKACTSLVQISTLTVLSSLTLCHIWLPLHPLFLFLPTPTPTLTPHELRWRKDSVGAAHELKLNHLSTITPFRLQLQHWHPPTGLGDYNLVELFWFLTVYSSSNSDPFIITTQTTFIHIRISHCFNCLFLTSLKKNGTLNSTLEFHSILSNKLTTYHNYDILLVTITTLWFHMTNLEFRL